MEKEGFSFVPQVGKKRSGRKLFHSVAEAREWLEKDELNRIGVKIPKGFVCFDFDSPNHLFIISRLFRILKVFNSAGFFYDPTPNGFHLWFRICDCGLGKLKLDGYKPGLKFAKHKVLLRVGIEAEVFGQGSVVTTYNPRSLDKQLPISFEYIPNILMPFRLLKVFKGNLSRKDLATEAPQEFAGGPFFRVIRGQRHLVLLSWSQKSKVNIGLLNYIWCGFNKSSLLGEAESYGLQDWLLTTKDFPVDALSSLAPAKTELSIKASWNLMFKTDVSFSEVKVRELFVSGNGQFNLYNLRKAFEFIKLPLEKQAEGLKLRKTGVVNEEREIGVFYGLLEPRENLQSDRDLLQEVTEGKRKNTMEAIKKGQSDSVTEESLDSQLEKFLQEQISQNDQVERGDGDFLQEVTEGKSLNPTESTKNGQSDSVTEISRESQQENRNSLEKTGLAWVDFLLIIILLYSLKVHLHKKNQALWKLQQDL
uniref:Uncharacterized protein orf478 n=1 Tax=Neglectella solitaria TaxID=120749 RepID=C7BEJ8_NEGSO|nr:hypothetical protein [Neglectella solitaria]